MGLFSIMESVRPKIAKSIKQINNNAVLAFQVFIWFKIIFVENILIIAKSLILLEIVLYA